MSFEDTKNEVLKDSDAMELKFNSKKKTKKTKNYNSMLGAGTNSGGGAGGVATNTAASRSAVSGVGANGTTGSFAGNSSKSNGFNHQSTGSPLVEKLPTTNQIESDKSRSTKLAAVSSMERNANGHNASAMNGLKDQGHVVQHDVGQHVLPAAVHDSRSVSNHQASQQQNYMVMSQQGGFGGFSNTPVCDSPQNLMFGGSNAMGYGFTDPSMMMMSQNSSMIGIPGHSPASDFLTLQQQQQQQIQLLQQQIEILKLQNQAQSLGVNLESELGAAQASLPNQSFGVPSFAAQNHSVLPSLGVSNSEFAQNQSQPSESWDKLDSFASGATGGIADSQEVGKKSKQANSAREVTWNNGESNREDSSLETKQQTGRVLPPPGTLSKKSTQYKSASSWDKPKAWLTHEKNSKDGKDDKWLGDNNKDESTFVTKSDMQGKIYRDMNNAESRADVEKELFGADRHTTAGLDFDKYDDIPVEATGNGIPEIMNSFEEAGLCKPLLENIKRASYTRPTPIQKHAIPMCLAGRDIMACAQTGSGKTAAFLFPIIHSVIANGETDPIERKRGNYRSARERRVVAKPSGLILAPTRELASQIHDESLRFTYQTNVRCVVLYGGAEIYAQIEELNRGCRIVVATPGRLDDLIQRGNVSLSKVTRLVLDEADRMLDMGFEPQIRQIVQEYDMPQGDLSIGGRQTSMFSATFPQDIQKLAGDFMSDYIFVTVGRVGATANSITQVPLWVEDKQKMVKLIDVMESISGLTLVFVETKRLADTLHHELCYRRNIKCTSIHGDRSQREREQALWEFSTQRVNVLIATEVAARGLDIPSVAHVINYDLPSNIDSYVHRIGRTGRAGNKGVATSFFNEKNLQLTSDLVRVLEESQQEVPQWLAGISKAPDRGRSGGNNFGGRDFRRQQGMQNTGHHNGHHRDGDGRGSSRRGGSSNRRGGRGKRFSNKAPVSSTDSW